MHAAQRGQHHRQYIGGHQGQTKAEEGRLRIASGVDCGMAVRLQVFERGFQRPAVAGECSHLWGRHLARHIRQAVENRRPVSGRFVHLETPATHEMLVAVRIHHTHAAERLAPLASDQTSAGE